MFCFFLNFVFEVFVDGGYRIDILLEEGGREGGVEEGVN